jgi:hypothetical protein
MVDGNGELVLEGVLIFPDQEAFDLWREYWECQKVPTYVSVSYLIGDYIPRGDEEDDCDD